MRVAILLFVLTMALIVAISLFESGLGERRELEESLVSGETEALKGRGAPGGQVPIWTRPADRPGTEDDVLLEILAPPESGTARRGGPVLLSLRGNGVLYRRAGERRAGWTRATLPGPRQDALLAAGRDLPEAQPGATTLRVWTAPETYATRRLSAAERADFLSRLEDVSGRPHPARTLRARFSRVEEPVEEARDWPSPLPSPPAESTEWTAERRFPVAAESRRVLSQIELGAVYRGPDAAYRLRAYATRPR